MYKEAAVEIIAKYIADVVSGARGSIISISTKQVGKWYEKRFGRPMPRKAMFHVVKVLRALYALGALQKIGNKFVFEKGSQLWKCAKEGKTRECIAELAAKYAELVGVA